MDSEHQISETKVKQAKQAKLLLFISAIVSKYPLLQCKTRFCKHDYGCVYNVIQGFLRSFILAYGVKALFGLLSVITAKGKKVSRTKLLMNGLFGRDTIQFALFPSVYNVIQKSVLCGSRHLWQEEKKSVAFFSGFAAGALSLKVMDQQKRKNWALYLLTRALDTIFQAIQVHGYVKPRGYYYVIFMGLEVLITGYAYGSENDCLEDYMLKFYTRFSGEGKTENDFRACWHEMKRRSLQQSNEHIK